MPYWSKCGNNIYYCGKNTCFDQSSPEQPDHLILLIDYKVKWSTKTGGK